MDWKGTARRALDRNCERSARNLPRIKRVHAILAHWHGQQPSCRGSHGVADGLYLNQWRPLIRYAHHERVEIGNNLAENAISLFLYFSIVKQLSAKGPAVLWRKHGAADRGDLHDGSIVSPQWE